MNDLIQKDRDGKTVRLEGRVAITGDHPWAGQSGKYVKLENTLWGLRPIVKLDNGTSCFVMKPQDWVTL